MTLPYERSRAVVETKEFLTLLLGNLQVPASVRSEAKRLLRHYPSANQIFQAGWHELASPACVLEPIFDTSVDGKPSERWPSPRQVDRNDHNET